MTASMLDTLSLTDMDRTAMEQLAVSLGQPRFRGRQLFEWVHHRLETDLARMSNLPRELVSELASGHRVARAELAQELVSSDGATRKRLLSLADGRTVESVLIPSSASEGEAGRHTVCVSSQVGCALGCTFCITGQMGFGRQLTAGEIVEQVYHFERELRLGARAESHPTRRLVSNIVFMGMGEPLANYQATVSAIRLLLSPEGFGLGARRITVSTAGLVPGIGRLAMEGLQLGLAVSLHAANDRLREQLMPINRRYPIAQLIQAADHYATTTGRRVTYEYALMDKVNDSVSHARELVGLLSGRLCHVNLIPLNPSLDLSLRPSSPQRIASFRSVLEEARIPCTLRQTKGQDILAACGQLGYNAKQ